MSKNVEALQVGGGRFPVAGYAFFDIRFPMDVKPKHGFVYVVLPDGDIGAIPDNKIENWDDLPLNVYLHPKLQEKKIQSLLAQGLI